jgi:SLA1 homology domain 1, SHD1
MFALLLAWASLGVTTGAADEVTSKNLASSASRDWTDASGAKHVRAILLRIEGDQLWLRRSDGKLTTTTVSQLSSADRQYVATNSLATTTRTAVASTAAGLTTQIVRKIGDQVQSIVELPRWTKGSQSDAPVLPVPAALVYVRVSRQFLEDYVERSVRRTKPVNDYILGVRIEGESDTRGKTSLELLPSSGRLMGEIAFEGTVHAQTRGYKSPVVLHQVSESRFRSSKLISLDNNGLRVAPATTTAPTDLTTTNIGTSLPRLRGRIATRIAWGRVANAHQEAESITSQHTAATVSHDFDERIDQSVAKVREVFKTKAPPFEREDHPVQTEMRFRSSPECVEMAMIRREATSEERKLRPPMIDGNPDVAVRMHRAMLTRAMTDPKIRDDLAPLFVKLLNARFAQKKDSGSKAEKTSPPDTTKWSFDSDWLAMDFMDSVR